MRTAFFLWNSHLKSLLHPPLPTQHKQASPQKSLKNITLSKKALYLQKKQYEKNSYHSYGKGQYDS